MTFRWGGLSYIWFNTTYTKKRIDRFDFKLFLSMMLEINLKASYML